MAVYTKKYNGSSWVTAPVKKWNGSAWVDAKVMKWTGSAWSQLYPETAVTTSKSISSTSFNTYRSKWDNDGVAKQGVYSSYAAAHGYLGINANTITGSGSISSVASATFSSTRDGSGSYNNNQTVRFHRSNVNSTAVSPVNTMSGQFTSTTGGPGSGGAMNNRAITVSSETVNWMNQANSKGLLYIYSSATADYAGMKTKFTINLNNYVYTAKTLAFESEKAIPLLMTADMYKATKNREPYHSMTVYEDEVNMTLEEIIQRRVDGIVEDIPYDSIIQAPDIKPWTRNYEVYESNTLSLNKQLFVKVEVFNMGMDDEAQYSLDGEEWFTLIGKDAEDDYLYGELPSDFNKYKDFIFVRTIDKKKELIHNTLTIEPKIYIPDQSGIIIVPGDIDLDSIVKD